MDTLNPENKVLGTTNEEKKMENPDKTEKKGLLQEHPVKTAIGTGLLGFGLGIGGTLGFQAVRSDRETLKSAGGSMKIRSR